ncbi:MULTISPECIES: hydrolase [unclassified Vibrio]|nr:MULTISPECIES: hydrolase [unclassified Vibrio]MDW1637170.1 hydrolase [Vibrio sp. Vb2907]MDW1707945.1 hydrolase [Vibrio sp. Vb2917]MDW1722492.1 hydrolase [Vibrio sp. Vb2979]
MKHSHNKAFKSDSQRLALSLRSSIAKRRSHLNAALCALGEMEMEMDIPDRFKNVRYVSSRIPGCKDDSDLTLGANCQVFAYNLLRDFGLNPPNYRSSELWDDSEFSEVVIEFKPLDIMMYNDSTDSYGAHVGVYVGNGLVYHLSLSNGVPMLERHLDLLQQSKYQFFIGAKRIKQFGA